jgi:hypothetical protein
MLFQPFPIPRLAAILCRYQQGRNETVAWQGIHSV